MAPPPHVPRRSRALGTGRQYFFRSTSGIASLQCGRRLHHQRRLLRTPSTHGQRLRAQLSPRPQRAATPKSKSSGKCSACQPPRPAPTPATRTIHNHFRVLSFVPHKSEDASSLSRSIAGCSPGCHAVCRSRSPCKLRRTPARLFRWISNPVGRSLMPLSKPFPRNHQLLCNQPTLLPAACNSTVTQH